MTDALKVVPSDASVNTGVSDTATVAAALGDILADTYHLTFKTHAYHWNVEGPLFFSIHNLTEGQYENMFAAADELAERIRALGHLAPGSLNEIVKRSAIEDQTKTLSAENMVQDLASDHERLANRLHALIGLTHTARCITPAFAVERQGFIGHGKSPGQFGRGFFFTFSTFQWMRRTSPG